MLRRLSTSVNQDFRSTRGMVRQSRWGIRFILPAAPPIMQPKMFASEAPFSGATRARPDGPGQSRCVPSQLMRGVLCGSTCLSVVPTLASISEFEVLSPVESAVHLRCVVLDVGGCRSVFAYRGMTP